MTKYFGFKCDACDKIETNYKFEDTPVGWTTFTIEGLAHKGRQHLCPLCTRRLKLTGEA